MVLFLVKAVVEVLQMSLVVAVVVQLLPYQ
jgi:hypothetical protein